MESFKMSSNIHGIHNMCMYVQTYTYAEFTQNVCDRVNKDLFASSAPAPYTYDPMCIDDMAFLCDSDDECIADADMEEVYM